MRLVPVMILALLATLGGTAAGANEPEKAPAPEPEKTATASATEPFVPPDGWREKKRGKYTVYCRKETEVGTRFQKETCYDQEGIRAMLAAQQDDREKVDQMRRICGSQDACGSR